MGIYSAYIKPNFNPQPSQEWPGLKFTSNQDNSTIGYVIAGTVNKDIYTSTDGKTWTSWDGSNITLNNGESVYVWNKTNTLSTSGSIYLKFTMSGSIAASGNINSMINFSELSPYCYNNMFFNCTSLTTLPELPANNLATYCYSRIFMNCTNIITAPYLPATNLAEHCYSGMFSGCTNLITAPDLPATILAESCYASMFVGCSRLNSIKLSYTGNFSTTYFSNWVKEVSSSGTLYYNGSDTTRGTSAIPEGWTVQTF